MRIPHPPLTWVLGDRCCFGAWRVYSNVLSGVVGLVGAARVQPSPSCPLQVCSSTLATACGTARWRSAPGRRPSTRAPTSATTWTSTLSPWMMASPTPPRARATQAGVPLRTRASRTSKWQEQRKAIGRVAGRKAKAGTNRRRRLSSPTTSWTTRLSSGAGSGVPRCPADEEGSQWLPSPVPSSPGPPPPPRSPPVLGTHSVMAVDHEPNTPVACPDSTGQVPLW